jgi:hypothetical protein
MPEYAIPDRVLRNAQLRLAAHKRIRICVTPGCDQAATHSPCTGHDSCESHRTTPPTPSPDPTRTLAALRDRMLATDPSQEPVA